VLVRGAVQQQQLDLVAAALMERCRKHEHVPALAAQAAKLAEEAYNSTQLVRAWWLCPGGALRVHTRACVCVSVCAWCLWEARVGGAAVGCPSTHKHTRA
jgi:hypothetical protein